mmetsp:Transcript_10354/g.20750  ORF Transcript_10354/g.20750 Transcript_10354/m.20750 type:complete len:124 (-) Transcript_10354:609-980(-)
MFPLCVKRYDIYMAPASVTVGIDRFVFLLGSNVQDESMDRRDESAETESMVLDDQDESDTDASDSILDEKDTVLGRLSPSSPSCCDDITEVSNFRGNGSDSSLSCLDHDDECESSQGCSSNEK